jgi:hypothetical protein
LRDDDLKSLLEAEQKSALGYLGGDLSDARKKAMDYYLGEPFGNEVEGRSKVISTDVADTIEWMLPSLMKMFTAGDDVVSFTPQGEEDEEGAKQATEYNNWIFLKDNDGFRVLYSMFKDALLQRTGACKVYPEFNEKEELDDFLNVPDDQYSVMALQKQEDNAKTQGEYTKRKWKLDDKILWYLKEHTEEQGPLDPMTGQPTMLHGGVWCRTKKSMKVCVEPVPPEELLISKRAKGDIDEPSYMAHRAQKTASELIKTGYSKKKVEALGGDEANTDQEKTARMKGIDEDPTGSHTVANEAMRLIWVTEAYPMVDYDDDGIAEMRRIVHAGQGAEILANEEWEGPRPFAVITPIIIPHRLIGLSIADQTFEFQLLKSTLWRQTLDNLYLNNNPMKYVNPSAVNVDDLLSPRAGGVIQPPSDGQFDPNGIVPIETDFVAAATLPMIEYVNSEKENRTGVTKYNQGSDADTLNKTARGISQIMGASQQRIELIARVFAEGVKRIFMLQNYYIRRYPELAKRSIRLRNKQWVEMDPGSWGGDFDLQINVGLGTGNKDQMLQHLMNIAMIQEKIVTLQGGVDGPLVTAENIYNNASKVVENSGFKNAEEFFTDPAPKEGQPPPQPKEPPPNPDMIKVQAQIEGDKAKLQMDGQKMQMEQQGKMQTAQLDEQAMLREHQLKEKLAIMEFELKKELAYAELALKAQSQQISLQQDAIVADREAQMAQESAAREQESEQQDNAVEQKNGADTAALMKEGFDTLAKALSGARNISKLPNGQYRSEAAP